MTQLPPEVQKEVDADWNFYGKEVRRGIEVQCYSKERLDDLISRCLQAVEGDTRPAPSGVSDDELVKIVADYDYPVYTRREVGVCVARAVRDLCASQDTGGGDTKSAEEYEELLNRLWKTNHNTEWKQLIQTIADAGKAIATLLAGQRSQKGGGDV